jgi:hypothetical protein
MAIMLCDKSSTKFRNEAPEPFGNDDAAIAQPIAIV